MPAIDTIKITIQGSRCVAYGNLIRAALEHGAKNFPDSVVRNLAANTHVEIHIKPKAPKMLL